MIISCTCLRLCGWHVEAYLQLHGASEYAAYWREGGIDLSKDFLECAAIANIACECLYLGSAFGQAIQELFGPRLAIARS